MDNGISVIICCYNSGWIIERCLGALSKQSFSKPIDWEIILVDNNCTDDTTDKAKKVMKGLNVDFSIVKETTPGLLSARIKGINTAKYDISIYCDDDNILNSCYLERLYDTMNGDIYLGACGGVGIGEWGDRMADYMSPQAFAVGCIVDNPKSLVGAGLCVRTKLVKDIYKNQRFYLTGRCGDKTLAGDDGELVKSILLRGFKICLNKQATFVHVIPANRLTYDYYERMLDGFYIASPIMRIYEKVLEGRKPHLYRAFLITLFYFIKLRFKSNNVSDRLVHRKYAVQLMAYRFWGFSNLYRLYKDLTKIKQEWVQSL